MSANDLLREAALEGASALKYRAERLRGMLSAANDEAAAKELVDKWTQYAAILNGFGAPRP